MKQRSSAMWSQNMEINWLLIYSTHTVYSIKLHELWCGYSHRSASKCRDAECRTKMEQLKKRNLHEIGVKRKDFSLFNLNPTDNYGVLLVGEQLENANKHPKIVPRDSRLAELLIKEAHDLTFHGGARLTMTNLIPVLLQAVK